MREQRNREDTLEQLEKPRKGERERKREAHIRRGYRICFLRGETAEKRKKREERTIRAEQREKFRSARARC